MSGKGSKTDALVLIGFDDPILGRVEVGDVVSLSATQVEYFLSRNVIDLDVQPPLDVVEVVEVVTDQVETKEN